MLTAEQIDEQFKQFLIYLKECVGDNPARMKAVTQLIKDYEDAILSAPASSRTQFHSAWPGGWLFHTNKVVAIAKDTLKMWSDHGAHIDFGANELVFAALFHDLGKLGWPNIPFYDEQSSDWHFKQGEVYSINAECKYLPTSERSVFILQQYQIQLSYNEYIAIRLADGMFFESNSPYFKYSKANPSGLPGHIAHILHFANWAATRIENDL